MFCPNCGKTAMEGAKFCEGCGTSLTMAQDAPPQNAQPQYQNAPAYQNPPPYGQPVYSIPLKNAGLAAVLALIIPGVGHIYIGRITEGIVYLVLAVILWVVGTIAAVFTFGLGFLIPVIFWIWQIYDAYNKANQYNTAVQQTGRAPW